MGFEITKESYAGSIKEIIIGSGSNAVTLGGKTCYPFYQFEGNIPNKPKIAMEIWDMEPTDWPEAALAPFKDVVNDTGAWAKKCIDKYDAEMIVLQLKSTDPNDKDASPKDAVASVKKVLDAVDIPLIIWGSAVPQKDELVFKKICEEFEGKKLTLGPVEEKNHKGIAASAMGFGHTVISSSPIDVNLSKQINILLENIGMPMDRVMIDPTTGGLGYGLEYSFSVMERLLMAALTQGDDKLQFPLINNLGNEVWKCKECKQTVKDAPELGDPERRGILMEAVCAVVYLTAGSDLLFMRHPEAIRLVKAYIDLMMYGGMATDVDGIFKKMADVDVDFAKFALKPDLAIEKEEKKDAPAKKASIKEMPAKKSIPAKKTIFEKSVKLETELKVKANTKVKVDTDTKAKADADAKAKADADAKAKADADAKAKADADAIKKADDDAYNKREAEALALKEKRTKEREKFAIKKEKDSDKSGKMTPSAVNKDMLDIMIEKLNRIHKRNI